MIVHATGTAATSINNNVSEALLRGKPNACHQRRLMQQAQSRAQDA